MTISTKGRYGLSLMLDVLKNQDVEAVRLKDSANRQNISEKYLEQIAIILSKGGLLQSSRGAHGGYRLSRKPEEYSVGEILTLLEGNLAYHPFLNTIICMVYDFLPFMIMPIYNSLMKLDDSLLEAGRDLGANSWQLLYKVLLPLSIPGIISGVTMVFLPAMTNYVVLDMVYNSTYIMGSLIGSYFSAYDWNNGSLISAILLMFIGLMTVFADKFSAIGEK